MTAMLDNMTARLAKLKLGPFRYNSPWMQVAMVGFVCFCSVGMSSAIGGLGAGGSQDAQLASLSSAVLYATFTVTGLLGGAVNNILGPRLTLAIGCSGYSLYNGSLWAYQLHGTRWFVILSGALLGVSAGLLWAAQGAIMMSYPAEADKGRSFSLFWTIFMMGALMGSAIALGIEAKSTLSEVSTTVYVVMVAIMVASIFIAFLILPPEYVVRADGSLVDRHKSHTVKRECAHLLAQFKDVKMLALFPAFFASNYFYAYQSSITAHLFNGRTRALTSLLVAIGSITGSIFIGIITDRLPYRRRARALLGLAIVVVIVLAVWSGGIAYQTKFKRTPSGKRAGGVLDWTNSDSIPPLILLLCYYIVDAAFQGLAYYSMSIMTNDPDTLARMAGYYKGVQSAGAAVSFGMDSVLTPYMTEILVSVALLIVSFPLTLWVFLKAKDTNYEDEDVLKVQDADHPDVAVPDGVSNGQRDVDHDQQDKDEKLNPADRATITVLEASKA